MDNTSGVYHYNITKSENYALEGALMQVKECIKNGCEHDIVIKDTLTDKLIVHIENGVIKWMEGGFAQTLYSYQIL